MLVRRMAPLPEVPDRLEPLGPPLQKRLRSPSWTEFVESLCPPVRELKPGERPSNWVSEPVDVGAEPSLEPGPAPAREREAAEPLPPLEEPQLYQPQFTTTEEHAQLIEKAAGDVSRPAERTTQCSK